MKLNERKLICQLSLLENFCEKESWDDESLWVKFPLRNASTWEGKVMPLTVFESVNYVSQVDPLSDEIKLNVLRLFSKKVGQRGRWWREFDLSGGNVG